MSKKIDNTSNNFRVKLAKLLSASGVEFNGKKPWDIQVYNPNVYERIVTHGVLGMGEAYMDEWWDTGQLDECFYKFSSAKIIHRVKFDPYVIKNKLWAYFSNRQSRNQVPKIITHHYDMGNGLYQAMLDKRLTYSCAYWKNADNLDEAQEHKFDLICRKLNLQAGQRLLDIGCGWASFIKYAAENYGVSCVGITLSEQQFGLGKELCKGLPVELRLMDYRDLQEEFDHVVSIGMFEHVGYKNYHQFMLTARRCLKDEGLFLLHTIGRNRTAVAVDPWINKYIFPGGMLPSINQISKATEGSFIMEDWHNFGADYDKTLMCWYQNFADNWQRIKHKYDERFFRMWKYYLLTSAGAFRARANQLWQVVLSKNGVPGGYVSIR